ncbi:hypothetical protein [Streptomyces sp. bgisy095]|uniref:hypothetical protein n=1 Tax=unclassified Streptomyces TaxID=2593676 RepID=UPI003D73272D
MHAPSDLIITAATLTDGSNLKDWILLVAGNLLIAAIAVRAVRHFLKEDWGGMITMCVAVVFVGGFVWFPDQTKALFGLVWDKVREA